MCRFLSALFAWSAVVSAGFAQDASILCIVSGPPYQLQSDTVTWSMTLASGRSCLRGVIRSQYTTVENISVITGPQSGQVLVEGPAIKYKGDPDFRGQDTFSLLVSGKFFKTSGSSTVKVLVSVR
jgi:hypothetical protein